MCRFTGSLFRCICRHAQIFVTALDNSKTRVYSRTTGLLVPEDPDLESEVRAKAQEQIQQAALADGILPRQARMRKPRSRPCCWAWGLSRSLSTRVRARKILNPTSASHLCSYKFVDNPEHHEFEIGNVQVGSGKLFLIAGPCVIESETHVRTMADAIQRITGDLGIPYIFKASFDKANRTSVKSFRGPGLEEGCRILRRTGPGNWLAGADRCA